MRQGCKDASLARAINEEPNLEDSTRRVQQVLSSNPFLKYTMLKKKHPLLPRHKTARHEWARERHCWTPSQWHEVIFSDEKKVESQLSG